MQFTEVLMI